MQFIGYEMETLAPIDRGQCLDQLHGVCRGPLLVLNTCQRLEAFGMQQPELSDLPIAKVWNDIHAFERLARIAAGLESRIVGELEILGQVRQSYRRFHHLQMKSNLRLDRVFQDALALARRARKKSGIDQNLISISALAARELIDQVSTGEPLAVVGSGSLASSTARYLSKRGSSPIRVMSRCPENAIELAYHQGWGAGLLFSQI